MACGDGLTEIQQLPFPAGHAKWDDRQGGPKRGRESSLAGIITRTSQVMKDANVPGRRVDPLGLSGTARPPPRALASVWPEDLSLLIVAPGPRQAELVALADPAGARAG